MFGNTCACGESALDTRRELEAIYIRQTYNFLNLFCQLEQRITEAHNMEEFVQVCREFQFMVRDRSGLFLCLHENW